MDFDDNQNAKNTVYGAWLDFGEWLEISVDSKKANKVLEYYSPSFRP